MSSQKTTYNAYLPKNWEKMNSYTVLFLKGTIANDEFTQRVDENFTSKDIPYLIARLKIASPSEFYEQLEFAKMVPGKNAQNYYISNSVTPQKWIQFSKYESIQKLIISYSLKKLGRNIELIKNYFRFSA